MNHHCTETERVLKTDSILLKDILNEDRILLRNTAKYWRPMKPRVTYGSWSEEKSMMGQAGTYPIFLWREKLKKLPR